METLERIKAVNGFWIHEAYGGGLNHSERFRMKQKYESCKFISLDKIEKQFGKLEAIEDSCTTNHDYDCNITIWTDKFVLFIDEYDGYESLIHYRRNPSNIAESFTVGKRKVEE